MTDAERQIASYARPPLGLVGEVVAKKGDRTRPLSAKVYVHVRVCMLVPPLTGTKYMGISNVV